VDERRGPGATADEPGETVVLVAAAPAPGRLLTRVLTDAGYRAAWAEVPLRPQALVEVVRTDPPAALLLGLVGEGAAGGGAPGTGTGTGTGAGGAGIDGERLDALRADDATRRVPVVALAPDPAAAAAARASSNVAAVLADPFGPEEVVAAVAGALARPLAHAAAAPDADAPGEGLARAKALLARHSRAALFRWALRLLQRPPWAGRDDLGLADVFDDTPVLLEALDVALGLGPGDPARVFAVHPALLDRTRAHARIRRAQALPLVALLREVAVLRDEVWGIYRRTLPPRVGTDDLLDLAATLDGVLDRLLEETVTAYLAAGGDPAGGPSAGPGG
jgi:DNA-binding response OmpR family regulator